MVKQEKMEEQQGSASGVSGVSGREEQDGQWLKLSFICPLALMEAVSDLLTVCSDSGVEESPATAAGCRLSGFFYVNATEEGAAQAQVEQIKHETKTALAELFALYGEPLPEFEQAMLADEDWANSWKEHFKTFAIAPGLVIKPSWEEYMPSPGEQVLEMDPGMAFGTGRHATTRGALQLIKRSMQENIPNRVLDVGTGTGILAMGTALWGVPEVLALDNDPEAVRVAGDNVVQNKLSGRIRVELTSVEQVKGSYGLISANIVHDVLVEMLPHLRRLTARPGFLVLAGILAGGQERNITKLYAQAGFTLLGCEYEEEWVSLLFRLGGETPSSGGCAGCG